MHDTHIDIVCLLLYAYLVHVRLHDILFICVLYVKVHIEHTYVSYIHVYTPVSLVYCPKFSNSGRYT